MIKYFLKVFYIYFIFLNTSIIGCTYHEAVVYDDSSMLNTVSSDVTEKVISSGNFLYLTFTDGQGGTQTLKGKLKKSNVVGTYHFYLWDKSKRNTTDQFVTITTSQIKKMRVVEKDGLQTKEVVAALVIVGLAILVLMIFEDIPFINPGYSKSICSSETGFSLVFFINLFKNASGKSN